MSIAEMFLKSYSNLISLEEMANLRQETTGLPVVIWVSIKSGKERHGPRIKVQVNHSTAFNVSKTVTLTISESPLFIGDCGELNSNDKKELVDFVLRNKTTLLSYWNGRIDTAKLIKDLL